MITVNSRINGINGEPAFPDATAHCVSEVFLTPDLYWTVNNSNLYDYSDRFSKYGFEGSIQDDVTERYSAENNDVALDLCAGQNAMALQDLIKENVVSRALATNLEDNRDEHTRNIEELYHLSGNLLLRDFWDDLKETQSNIAPEGFSIVFHFPVGALQFLDKRFYRKALFEILDMTKSGGSLYFQVPEIVGRQYIRLQEEAPLPCITEERDDIAEIEHYPKIANKTTGFVSYTRIIKA